MISSTLERVRPRTYRGALIGAGGVARQSHLPAFDDPRVRARLELVATVDGACAAPLDRLPHLPHRDDLDALAPIDFVDICTPTASHLELVLWALERGFHVLCEKPVATTRAESAAIASAARRAGRVVMPCHQYRYNPVWRQVSEWLRAGAIGRWHLAELHVYRVAADGGRAANGATPWRGRAVASRGGVLLDHGTHLLYQMLDVGGMPCAVRAWTGRLRHADYDVEDSAQIALEYPDRLATMFLTWAARHRENRLRFVGERGAIEWVGGELRLEREGQVTTWDRAAELEKSAYARWFAELFGTFASAVDAGAGEAPLEDIARVAALLEATYGAARSGRAERVHDGR